jgi:hypothetical protein
MTGIAEDQKCGGRPVYRRGLPHSGIYLSETSTSAWFPIVPSVDMGERGGNVEVREGSDM